MIGEAGYLARVRAVHPRVERVASGRPTYDLRGPGPLPKLELALHRPAGSQELPNLKDSQQKGWLKCL
eukprot:scaffold43883_cov34-Prasinocladus_malaysianus.AAC.1